MNKQFQLLLILLVIPVSLAACSMDKSNPHSDNAKQPATKPISKEVQKRDAEVTQKVNAHPAELTGEVIDAWCYCSKVMGDGRGKEHEKCAKLCVAGGVSAGILTDDGTVYIAAKHQGYKGANGILLPFVAKRVKVKGWVAERGGIKVVKVRTVTLLDEDKNKPESAEAKEENEENEKNEEAEAKEANEVNQAPETTD